MDKSGAFVAANKELHIIQKTRVHNKIRALGKYVSFNSRVRKGSLYRWGQSDLAWSETWDAQMMSAQHSQQPYDTGCLTFPGAQRQRTNLAAL